MLGRRARVVGVAALRDDERLRRLSPALVGRGDDGDVGDDVVFEEGVLQLDRGDVLPAGDDDVLLAVLDRDEAVLVDDREVAHVVVPLQSLGERLLGGLGLVPVAVHHLVAPHDDLTDRFAVGGHVLAVLVDDAHVRAEIADPLRLLDREAVVGALVEVALRV